MLPLKSV